MERNGVPNTHNLYVDLMEHSPKVTAQVARSSFIEMSDRALVRAIEGGCTHSFQGFGVLGF